MKKDIQIFFTDMWEPFNIQDNFYTTILRQYYTLHINKKNPDFLFCSCFGHEHCLYSCVKICCLGENLCPNFNSFDYVYGFDHMQFDDRYFRMPLYRLYMSLNDYRNYDTDFFKNIAQNKTKFCNFLYSNGRNAAVERENFFHLLSRYKLVESGGSFLNNIGERVGDKRAWQQDFKFSIAFENSSKNGYTTEKLLEALQSHTIPIYWGNPRVAEDFNPDRFINCHDYRSFEAVVAKVQELDCNPEQYTEMLSQPWFTDSPPLLPQDDPAFTGFLRHIIDQGSEKAQRVVRNGFSYQYHIEEQMARIAATPLVKAKLKMEGLLRSLRHKIS